MEIPVELNVSLDGDKRVSATIGNHHIATDQPENNGGGDSAPSPYDLLMASIGCCAGYYVQQYCTSKGLSTEGISLTLRQNKSDAGELLGFTTCINIPDTLPSKYHSILKNVAKQCSVKKAIMSGPEFEVETLSVPTAKSA